MLSKPLRKVLFILFFVACLASVLAFVLPEPLFRFPLNGNDIALSGTFGELRTNHFHSGIDIKTGGRTGLPVYAVEAGYVYRLKVSPYGFGKAVYLRHEDGKFSVYGHLDHFSESLDAFVYQKQYASKKYDQEIYLSSNEIFVKKGDLIAYSGNSGSSGGPHLHFEIREPNEDIINPLQYYGHLIKDHKPPILKTVALQPIGAGSRIGGDNKKIELTPEGSNGFYSLPNVIEVEGAFGLEYHAWDILDAASNHCGINYATLKLDGKVVFHFALDRYAFDDKKYINVHFDYAFNESKNTKYQRAWLADGNRLKAYHQMENRGIIVLRDAALHVLTLELRDLNGNKSTLTAKVKQKTSPKFPILKENLAKKPRLSSSVDGNSLFIRVSYPWDAHLKGLDLLYSKQDKKRILPDFNTETDLVYRVPIVGREYPEAVFDPVTGEKLSFNFVNALYPERNNIVELEGAQFYFPFEAVFDTLHLEVSASAARQGIYSRIYKVGTKTDPLFKSFVISIKPNYSGSRAHAVIAYQRDNGSWAFLGNNMNEDGSVYASSGYFGIFSVMADSIPPRITPQNFESGRTIVANQKDLSIRLTDNFSGINSDRILMQLDYNWVLGEFDAKTSTVKYTWKSRPAPGKHKLEVMVYDNAGNLQEISLDVLF